MVYDIVCRNSQGGNGQEIYLLKYYKTQSASCIAKLIWKICSGKITLGKILLNFRDKSITLPILGFIRIISGTISSFSHSVNKTKVNIMIDNVEIHSVDTNRVLFFVCRFRSVLKVT